MRAARCSVSTRAFVPVWSTVLACGVTAMPADAGILFADSFRYANGNLAGNAGGSGWAGAWAGGVPVGVAANGNMVSAPLVVNPSDATARSIRISSVALETKRSLSTTYQTGGANSYWVSFVFNANPFSTDAGAYAGVSLYLDSVPPIPSNSLLLGSPGSSGQLGFDWTNRGDPNVAASNGVNYLILCAITPGSGSTTSVSMYSTTDLWMSGASLAATTPIVSLLNEPNFSFNTVMVSGAYGTGSISLAGLAMADNATDAVTFTQNAVPGPGAMLVLALAARFGAAPGAVRRRASTIAGG